ncbi:MAG: hypothetical protein KME06_14080 [Kastovskya adunca ATA6-11-RM4]|nr:hypothetical protein [Kastovskya adunca ATA6-11-RM4]
MKKWRERSHSTYHEIAFLCQKSLFEASLAQKNLLFRDSRRNSHLQQFLYISHHAAMSEQALDNIDV